MLRPTGEEGLAGEAERPDLKSQAYSLCWGCEASSVIPSSKNGRPPRHTGVLAYRPRPDWCRRSEKHQPSRIALDTTQSQGSAELHKKALPCQQGCWRSFIPDATENDIFPPTHVPTHSPTHPPTHSLTHSPTHPLAHCPG